MEQQEKGAAVLEPAPFEVVGSNIIVELVQPDDVTESGIVLAGVEQKRPPEVTVVGIGVDALRQLEEQDVDVKLGSVLVVRKHNMLRLELSEDGRELHVLKPSDVIGIIA